MMARNVEIRIRKGFTATVDFDGLTPETRDRLLAHGIKQKVADAGAGITGAAAKRRAGMAVLRAITAGRWTLRGGEAVVEAPKAKPTVRVAARPAARRARRREAPAPAPTA
jgi:hypothetical protein